MAEAGLMAQPLFDRAALARKSKELEGAPAQAILEFALGTYPKIAISTAFGLEGCALIDMAVQIKPDVLVFTVDTDYLFEETLALRQKFIERYRLNLQVFKPLLTIAEQEKKHGLRLYESNPDQCCAIRKVEPTERAILGLDAWIAGLRRDQSPTRATTAILERFDHADGQPYVKVNPLADWTRKDTWRYILEHQVPYQELLDRGYKSIGCWPCTRPVAEGEHERAGRWSGQAKVECGIHTFSQRKGEPT